MTRRKSEAASARLVEVADALLPWLRELPPAWAADVEVEFFVEVLGSQPSLPIAREWLLKRQKDTLSTELQKIGASALESDEIAAALVEETGAAIPDEPLPLNPTVFYRDRWTGRPVFADYQWVGFFKDRISVYRMRRPARRGTGTALIRPEDVASYLSVWPRWIPLYRPDGSPVEAPEEELCQRPLRRRGIGKDVTAIAASEQILPPFRCQFRVVVFSPDDGHVITPSHVALALALGRYHGFLQWRNGGKGRFTVTRFDVQGWDG